MTARKLFRALRHLSVTAALLALATGSLEASPFANVSNLNGSTVPVIDTATSSVTTTIDDGAGAQGVAVSPSGTRMYVANVTAVAAPTITSGAPPSAAYVGAPYNFTLTASGSPTFSVTSGALPNGLSLSSGGVISGTPTTPGNFSGTITASNGTLPNATQSFQIFVSVAEEREIVGAPTLSEWAVILLALALAAIGAMKLRLS
jgi:hypothetical protein